jgi:hypothetical protein
MKTLVTIAIIVTANSLLGCPPPPVGHLHNNTAQSVSYCSGWHCTEIPPGAISEVRITYAEPFRFKLRVSPREFTYVIEHFVPRDYARRQPESNCPNCPRYFFQLQPDLRIFLLGPELAPPASTFPSQPEGFPLVPSESAA